MLMLVDGRFLFSGGKVRIYYGLYCSVSWENYLSKFYWVLKSWGVLYVVDTFTHSIDIIH